MPAGGSHRPHQRTFIVTVGCYINTNWLFATSAWHFYLISDFNREKNPNKWTWNLLWIYLLISSLVTELQLVLIHTGIFQEATEMFILNLFNLINV